MIDGATREDIVRWNRYQCEKEKRKKYRRKQKNFYIWILYRNDPMDVRFGRIYDCGQCHNENSFNIHTTSNISVFHNRQGNH